MLFDYIKNKTVFANKYKTHSEAMIVSCFFNPQNSPYRIKAFNHFYKSIKHLNHQIIECVIGDAQPQLEESENIKRVYTDNLLWHKEALLNKLISELPKKYKYIFWVDADVIFTNLNWLVDGVQQLQENNIIQPFEYCVHLERDEIKPSFDMNEIKKAYFPNQFNNKVWRSFCSNFVRRMCWKSDIYNNHGHVGFAWAAKREILEAVPLYDKALIGGADHIIAHAAAGQIAHSCKRIQDFTAKTKQIVHRDKNGLYITNKADDKYMKDYFRHREVSGNTGDDGFLTSMALGYMTDSTLLGTALGGNIMGAMMGEMLNNNEHNHKDGFGGFGGGDSGGAGAGGTWDEDTKTDSTNVNNIDNDINSQTFS